MAEHLCVACPQLRDGTPRVYERPSVCVGCRSRMRSLLAEILDSYAQLVNHDPVNAGRWVDERGVEHTDPVAADLPAGPAGGSSPDDPVSGTPEPPLPGGEALNLTAPSNVATTGRLVPAYRTTGPPLGKPKIDQCTGTTVDQDGVRHQCIHPHGHIRQHGDGEHRWPYSLPPWQRAPVLDDEGRQVLRPDGDQDGEPSVVVCLDSWARDWQTYLPSWETLPQPDVSSLVGWLTDRLEWACEHHPAVDDFADEIRHLAAVLRSVAGLNRPPVEYKAGVPCRECERVALYRWPGSDWIECGACPSILSPDEYLRWVQLLAAHEPWAREIAERTSA